MRLLGLTWLKGVPHAATSPTRVPPKVSLRKNGDTQLDLTYMALQTPSRCLETNGHLLITDIHFFTYKLSYAHRIKLLINLASWLLCITLIKLNSVVLGCCSTYIYTPYFYVYHDRYIWITLLKYFNSSSYISSCIAFSVFVFLCPGTQVITTNELRLSKIFIQIQK